MKFGVATWQLTIITISINLLCDTALPVLLILLLHTPVHFVAVQYEISFMIIWLYLSIDRYGFDFDCWCLLHLTCFPYSTREDHHHHLPEY